MGGTHQMCAARFGSKSRRRCAAAAAQHSMAQTSQKGRALWLEAPRAQLPCLQSAPWPAEACLRCKVLASAMRAAAPCARRPSVLRGSGRPGRRYRRPPLRPAAASAAPPGDCNGSGGSSKQSPAPEPVSQRDCNYALWLGILYPCCSNGCSLWCCCCMKPAITKAPARRSPLLWSACVALSTHPGCSCQGGCSGSSACCGCSGRSRRRPAGSKAC